jgi:hypothetical protein
MSRWNRWSVLVVVKYYLLSSVRSAKEKHQRRAVIAVGVEIR